MLPLRRALIIFNQLLAAVEASHHVGVIHRDLKPENVMLAPRPSGKDYVKVLDFGIAQTSDDAPRPVGEVGPAMGTPAYMAPEQVMGKPAQQASDLYSCAVMLFEMLSGRQPFRAESVASTLANQMFNELPSIFDGVERCDLPEDMDHFFQKALTMEPAERFQTVMELRRALFDLFSEEEIRSLPCRSCHRLAHIAPTPASWDTPTIDLRSCGAEQGVDAEDEAAGPSARKPPAPRSAEWRLLRQFLEAPGGVLEITAPGGAGKSTLLARAARRGREQGMDVLVCRADPPLLARPWAPVRALMDSVLLPPGEALTADSLPAAASAIGLAHDHLPGLALAMGLPRGQGDFPEPAVLDQAVEAAHRALTLACAAESRRTVLLVLDDVHLFDMPSLLVVQAVCQDPDAALKVLLSAEGPALPHDGDHQSLRLAPLTEQEVLAVAGKRPGASRQLTSAMASSLAQQAGTSMLHLAQALAHLDEGHDPLVHQSLGTLIRGRLGTLTTAVRELLEVYAVGWSTLGEEVLKHLVPPMLDPSALRGTLEGSGLLTPDPAELQDPLHPELAAMVCAEAEPNRLVRLHREAFRALEAGGGAGLFTLAAHAFAAELGEQGFQLQRRAAAEARAQLDLNAAGQTFCTRAVSVAMRELVLPADDPRLVQLLLEQAEALDRSGHYLAAEDLLYQVLEAVPDDAPGLRATTLLTLSRVKEHMGETMEAQQAKREGEEVALKAWDIQD